MHEDEDYPTGMTVVWMAAGWTCICVLAVILFILWCVLGGGMN